MSDDDLIGPALPPSFRKSSSDDSDDEEGFAGPALPPGYKPELLSSSEDDFVQEEVDVVMKRRNKTSSRHGRGTTRDGPTTEKQHRVEEAVRRRLGDDDDDDGFFGPALPPGFSNPQASPERPAVLGPALPPGFHRPVSDDEDDDDGEDDFPRPVLPPGFTAESSSSDEEEEEEEEDEEVIGPMPAQGAIRDSVALDIERRAQKMKDRLTGADNGPEDVVRETWMTELPPTLQHIGLGARTFKKRAGPESKDRSLWTDTPADRERKLRERLEGKESGETEPVPRLSHKELQMAEKVSKYNETKRGESLISLHEKQMKKRKLGEGAKPLERRAFDRDQDLQVNKFDEAQKQRLLKKSQELNTRFGHSKEKMFL
ncbi:GPALPP motifs-containing protein 1 isoform X1 [Salmo salar]|uniref:GPALPP motifs-containing protein 1 n=2 Tax=Salmo salar TaxID=8030 RepID=A0ABM3E7W2_SALSA|nr:GPALPP motifs-containing protein 1-like isoform X1 [Salmo salar]